jgi:hypothetical protein
MEIISVRCIPIGMFTKANVPMLGIMILFLETHKCLFIVMQIVSQPYFWKSVRMTFTFPKWGLGSPPGLPKLQSLIAGVKTPCIEVLFISLENYQSVDVKNGLA